MNSREAFELAYPNIPWCDSPTELNTRQVAFEKGWQASRKQLLKELSETVPEGFAVEDKFGLVCYMRYAKDADVLIGEHKITPLIIRPTEEE